jgi:hypothetical protein
MVVVVFPTPPFWLAKAIIFPIMIKSFVKIRCEVSDKRLSCLLFASKIDVSVEKSPFLLITPSHGLFAKNYLANIDTLIYIIQVLQVKM